MSEQIYAGAAQYNLIYIFTIHDSKHEGYLKIGETSFSSNSSYKQLPPNCDELNRSARDRIDEYTRTAMVEYDLLHTELARIQVRLSDGTVEGSLFRDHNVHEVLDRSGFDRRRFYDTGRDSEWFKVNLGTAKAAIRAVKEGRNVLTAAECLNGQQDTETGEVGVKVPPQSKITLRDEQAECVAKTKQVFKKNDRMLWDCKMRFGKTITAYALVKQQDYQKVLVVTHRPAVVDGWENDFKLIFDDNRRFLKKDNIKEAHFTAEDASIDIKNEQILQNAVASGEPFIYFASMQDLRGSKIANGKYNKNRAVFSIDWDLIIYDEAHEGTQTDLGENVQKLLERPCQNGTKKKILQLSGTPYNLLNQYDSECVYSWDYVMEQRRKKEWDEKHPGDHNPYADLPELRICTFDLRDKMKTSYRYEDESVAFNFREFFRTWTGDPRCDFRPIPAGASVGDFVHKEDVLEFLNLITTDSVDSNYPFASQEYRDMFKHTFWVLPGVKEARAFSSLLKEHPIFKDYEVVNVAGEGDVEQPYDDALLAVRTAIQNHSHTITLSCGKLTTGVTVKEWNGVMLLSGSANASASGYMQTIFRVQSAGVIDGKQKKICYAFDFAPDRTLKVLSEVHQLKKNAVGADDNGRIQLGEFLNFCPVLAEGETGMEFYDVPKMMRQLKRMTVDAAVKSGFDDDSIYKADAGIVLDKGKIELIDLLKRKVSPQKKGKKENSIPINDQGLTDEQYRKAQEAKRKPKKERTEDERKALEKEREMKKKQRNLFDLLRNISIRLPLLIYGTATEFDESIRLEEFISIVDDASWKEFMPQDVDKSLFKKLLVFYDEDVISGAGMRIRRMAKAADDMMPTQRVLRLAEIFNCFRNPAKETVLTPWRVVNMHLGDTIGGYNFYREGYPEKDGLLQEPRLIDCGRATEDIFLNENVQVLEMNSKSGLYPLYMTYSIYRMLLPKAECEMTLDEAKKIWQKALLNHIFVLCQTKMAVSITRRTLVGYSNFQVNIIYLTKLLDRMQNCERLAHKLSNPKTWGKDGENMKFDAVVGNPPYQLETGNISRQAIPIYNIFVEQAKALEPKYISMIMPSRWFAGGMGLDQFRNSMMTDMHIRKVVDFVNAKDCFPQISISGGVCYFLRDANFEGECEFVGVYQNKYNKAVRSLDEFEVLVRYNQAVSIIHKIRQLQENSLSELVSPISPFGLATKERGNKDRNSETDLVLHSSGGQGYIEKEQVKKGEEYLDKYKVLVSQTSAEHASEPGKDGKFRILTAAMKVLGPEEICTHSYLLLGSFDSLLEAQNLLGYLKTRFARFLILQALSSIHLSRTTFCFVPLQDFTKSWTDDELYSKYGLTEIEIAFIESMIKPMDME